MDLPLCQAEVRNVEPNVALNAASISSLNRFLQKTLQPACSSPASPTCLSRWRCILEVLFYPQAEITDNMYVNDAGSQPKASDSVIILDIARMLRAFWGQKSISCTWRKLITYFRKDFSEFSEGNISPFIDSRREMTSFGQNHVDWRERYSVCYSMKGNIWFWWKMIEAKCACEPSLSHPNPFLNSFVPVFCPSWTPNRIHHLRPEFNHGKEEEDLLMHNRLIRVLPLWTCLRWSHLICAFILKDARHENPLSFSGRLFRYL